VGDGRVVGMVLGAGAIAGAAIVLSRVLSRSAVVEAPGSPRDEPPSVPPPPVPPPAAELPPVPPSRRGQSFDPDYPVEVWVPIINALIKTSKLIKTDYGRIDPRVATQWIAMESDGAPCAFGKPGEKGPDGLPREIGIGQLYNPDDFKIPDLVNMGITPASLRAYCAPNSQHRTRRLTDKEMRDQVLGHLAKIAQAMEVADGVIAKHGLHWSTADYWKLVKSVHGWPPIENTGLPAVVKKLGRAPTSWAEFRQALGMDVMVKDNDRRSKTYGEMIPKYPLWHRSLNNAEKLASVIATGEA
jgi:hypothetical protein